MIVIGEALVDLTPERSSSDKLVLTGRAGGSPANVAVGLARLGMPTRLAARISGDSAGGFLRTYLARSGIDLTLCVPASEPSTMAIADIGADGSATYSFYGADTADWQWKPRELPSNETGEPVHTGSMAVALGPGNQVIADWIAQQRGRGDVFISIDPNVRSEIDTDIPAYRARVESLIANAHLVKVSDVDLLTLRPDAEPLATATQWLRSGPELVVVTHGAAGSTALLNGADLVRCAPMSIGVVDTIGAGDAFTSGLLAYLSTNGALRVGACRTLSHRKLQQALHFATRVAALTCARAGADPPWLADLQAGALDSEFAAD